jgi:hypothetical protein
MSPWSLESSESHLYEEWYETRIIVKHSLHYYYLLENLGIVATLGAVC